MTTKPPSGLAASGSAEDADPDITKEQNEEGSSLSVDPSQDVTVEASEDVTMEAVGHTPPPSLRPGTVGVSPGQRAPTLLGVPIHSLPLPGVTANSPSGDATRTIDYDDEVTVLAQPTPNASPLRAAVEAELEGDELGDVDLGPSIVDDDEEETKVEAAESAMKAAESMDDVTTALSAQASLEREKALRRTAPAPASNDDLEFADPEADDQEQEESLDDELSDEDEVISAGGVVDEEDDLDDEPDTQDGEDDAHDGVATATFMKSPDATGLSGLLSPRRPPTGGRDGFGSRLPTPYSGSATGVTGVPAPSTSPFASRLGPAPSGSPPYGTRTTSNTPIAAIQVPPPSGAATTATGPTFFSKQVPMPGVALLCFGFLALGFGLRGAFTGKSTPTPTTIVAKPTAATGAPPAPVVEPVAAASNAPASAPVKPAAPAAESIKAAPMEVSPPAQAVELEKAPIGGTEQVLWKKKPAAKPRKAAIEAEEEAALKPAAASAPKPAPAATVASTPKAPAAKPAKKPTKAWVDPFAQ